MPKITILDTLYPDFISTQPLGPASTYEAELWKVMSRQFGTADFFSRNLAPLGWTCLDIVANHPGLQSRWASEHGWASGASCQAIALEQIKTFAPDVVFMQDLSFFDAATLRLLAGKYLLAGQCSCPMPTYENVKQFAVLFTSFPHYVKKFEEAGVKSAYLPLAFEPSVLEGPQPERDIDISFVGGVGRDSHWKSGTDTLEIIAQAFPARFQWWGYGLDRLPADSALRACYRGEAWGRQMYDVYRRSKIVINRHGEVAEGYTNNLRAFEATGCGGLLFTEDSKNLADFFVESNGVNPDPEVIAYASADEAVDLMEHFFNGEEFLAVVAANGQSRTLRDHTYSQRMKVVSETLTGMLQ